jgi:hypothetical protein
MSSFQHLSYPVDHYDPKIRHHVDQSDAVVRKLAPFLENEVTAKALRRLGDSLAPSSKVETSARQVIERVVRMLQQCPELSVDRCCVSGSFGKHTSRGQHGLGYCRCLIGTVDLSWDCRFNTNISEDGHTVQAWRQRSCRKSYKAGVYQGFVKAMGVVCNKSKCTLQLQFDMETSADGYDVWTQR